VDGLGRRFEVVATNIKKYPVGSPIQAPLEALSILIARHKITAPQVESMVVRMPSKRTVDDREMPDINLQYILAVTLLDGGLTFEAAHSYERMKDPAVLRLKERLTVIEEPGLRLPHTVRTGITEVRLRDGSVHREHVTAVPGTAEKPMTTAEVEAKCHGILAPVLGEEKTRALIAAVGTLERLPSVRSLRPLLAGG
jgi:2-methylcitrate dehydratase PrpD